MSNKKQKKQSRSKWLQRNISTLTDNNSRIFYILKRCKIDVESFPKSLIQLIITYTFKGVLKDKIWNKPRIIPYLCIFPNVTIQPEPWKLREPAKWPRRYYNFKTTKEKTLSIFFGGTITIVCDSFVNNGTIDASEKGYPDKYGPACSIYPGYTSQYVYMMNGSAGFDGWCVKFDGAGHITAGEEGDRCFKCYESSINHYCGGTSIGYNCSKKSCLFMPMKEEVVCEKCQKRVYTYGDVTLKKEIYHGSSINFSECPVGVFKKNEPVGGGTIIVCCFDTMINNGKLYANGGPGCSGGSILIVCRTLINRNNGYIAANGIGGYIGRRREISAAKGGDGIISIYADKIVDETKCYDAVGTFVEGLGIIKTLLFEELIALSSEW